MFTCNLKFQNSLEEKTKTKQNFRIALMKKPTKTSFEEHSITNRGSSITNQNNTVFWLTKTKTKIHFSISV